MCQVVQIGTSCSWDIMKFSPIHFLSSQQVSKTFRKVFVTNWVAAVVQRICFKFGFSFHLMLKNPASTEQKDQLPCDFHLLTLRITTRVQTTFFLHRPLLVDHCYC